MNFIQFGGTFINFDLVTSVRDLSSSDSSTDTVPGLIRIEFGNGRSLDVTGSLQPLRDWLLAHSTLVTTTEVSP